MKSLSIDINCDMGESYGRFLVGNDSEIFPYITSCNIACGFHGGDPLTIEKTIFAALEKGVNIGAHPSYPDLSGFGRRKMDIEKDELKSLIKYQVATLKGLTESLGGKITYVKPHGALYNSMVNNATETEWAIEAIKEVDDKLSLMGLAGSHIEGICKRSGIDFVAEAFGDRVYEADGTLRSRNKENSVISDPIAASNQVVDIAKNNQVTARDGTIIQVKAQSICIHGDNSNAVELLMAITQKLEQERITKKSFVAS